MDFGVSPIADSLWDTAQQASHSLPLVVHWCKRCLVLQLAGHIAPDALFSNDYPYFSSKIDTLVNRVAALVDELVADYQLDSTSRVVEIASNDGYLLQHFNQYEVNVLGIEPGIAQAAVARDKGIVTENVFFNSSQSRRIASAYGHADMVIANNVIAHVPEANDFVAGIVNLLNDHGVAVFEFHYAMDMLANLEYDTIYHQHIFYYSLHAFQNLLNRNGLFICEVEKIKSYGSSLRVLAKKFPQTKASVTSLLDREKKLGVDQLEIYQAFSRQAHSHAEALKALIIELVDKGNNISGYGAPAKATTLLSVCHLDFRHIPYVVDGNPHKQGKWLPGVNIPIYPPEHLRVERPDYVIIFAWNYAEEIIDSLAWFRQLGGKIITPIPQVKII